MKKFLLDILFIDIVIVFVMFLALTAPVWIIPYIIYKKFKKEGTDE